MFLGPTAFAADHREAPLIAADLTADIADIYAFRNPTISGSLVLIMTVNGFSAPAENVTFNFAPAVLYRFNIDSDGNAKPDHTIDFSFTPTVPGPQLFEARFSSGFEITGTVTLPSEEVVPNEPIIAEGPGGVRAFAGQRDDPFFFDVVGFFRFLAGTGSFTGTDGFSGFNVSAIAVEIPLDMLSDRNDHHGDDDDDDGTGALQIWAETLRPRVTVRRTRHDLQRHRGRFVQIERMGNPAINTALIPPELKDLFNVSRPKNDAEKFAPAIVESLMALGTNEENIGILASVAVPDTLKLDLSAPDGYPNGRLPQDDVIDTLFFFIFNQTEVPDGVDANDMPFLDEFPFLADPHQPPGE